MPKCIAKKRKNIKLCLGDREKVIFRKANLTGINAVGVDANIEYNPNNIAIYGIFEIVNGAEYFDGVNLSVGFDSKFWMPNSTKTQDMTTNCTNWVMTRRGINYRIEKIITHNTSGNILELFLKQSGKDTLEVNKF